jgi:hypothetical protein
MERSDARGLFGQVGSISEQARFMAERDQLPVNHQQPTEEDILAVAAGRAEIYRWVSPETGLTYDKAFYPEQFAASKEPLEAYADAVYNYGRGLMEKYKSLAWQGPVREPDAVSILEALQASYLLESGQAA